MAAQGSTKAIFSGPMEATRTSIVRPARPQPSLFFSPRASRPTPATGLIQRTVTGRENGLKIVRPTQTGKYKVTEKFRAPGGGPGAKPVTITRRAQMPRWLYEPVEEKRSCVKDQAAWDRIMAEAVAEKEARVEKELAAKQQEDQKEKVVA